MNYEERLKVYRQAIVQYGLSSQVMVAIEEMSELTKELCKVFRVNGATNVKIADEIADVMIMMAQLRMMFDIDDLVGKIMDAKVERLAQRLRQAGEGGENGVK